MLQVCRSPTPENREIFTAWNHQESQTASSRLKATAQDSPDFTNMGNSMHCMSWAPRGAPPATTAWVQFPRSQGALGAWGTCFSSKKMAHRLPAIQGWWDVPHNLHFKDPEPERWRQSHTRNSSVPATCAAQQAFTFQGSCQKVKRKILSLTVLSYGAGGPSMSKWLTMV